MGAGDLEVGNRSSGGTGIEAIMYFCIIFCLSNSCHCEAVKRAFPDTGMPPATNEEKPIIKITSLDPFLLVKKKYNLLDTKIISFLSQSPLALFPLHLKQQKLRRNEIKQPDTYNSYTRPEREREREEA